jgi:hypothetical protein
MSGAACIGSNGLAGASRNQVILGEPRSFELSFQAAF